MMNCDQALELISASLDESLTPAERQALDSHLADCPACRALLADFQKMNDVFSTLPAAPPAGLSQGVMDRIADQKQEDASKVTPFPSKKPRRRRWVRWGAAAAVFAVVILGAGRSGMLDVLVSRNAGAAPPAVSDTAENSAAESDAADAASRRSSAGAGDAQSPIQDADVPQSDAADQEISLPETAAAPAGPSGTGAAGQSGDDTALPADTPLPTVNALTVGTETPDAGPEKNGTSLTIAPASASLTEEAAETALLTYLEEGAPEGGALPAVVSLGLSSDGTGWLFACEAEDGVVHYQVPCDGSAIVCLSD